MIDIQKRRRQLLSTSLGHAHVEPIVEAGYCQWRTVCGFICGLLSRTQADSILGDILRFKFESSYTFNLKGAGNCLTKREFIKKHLDLQKIFNPELTRVDATWFQHTPGNMIKEEIGRLKTRLELLNVKIARLGYMPLSWDEFVKVKSGRELITEPDPRLNRGQALRRLRNIKYQPAQSRRTQVLCYEFGINRVTPIVEAGYCRWRVGIAASRSIISAERALEIFSQISQGNFLPAYEFTVTTRNSATQKQVNQKGNWNVIESEKRPAQDHSGVNSAQCQGFDAGSDLEKTA